MNKDILDNDYFDELTDELRMNKTKPCKNCGRPTTNLSGLCCTCEAQKITEKEDQIG